MTAEARAHLRRRPGRGARIAALVLAAGPWVVLDGREAAARWTAGDRGAPAESAHAPHPLPAVEALAVRALIAAQRFLLDAQDEDGAWRSREYSALRGGLALSGPALKVLLFAPTGADVGGAARRALDLYVERAPTPGADGRELVYPVYTAALASIALADIPGPEAERARAAWLELLLAHQLDEDLGWTPADLAYGGWSYAAKPPRRGEGGPFESDLSSTDFALGALRLCGVPADDPVIRRALRFVERCQDAASGAGGGFVLSPTNAIQNKSGAASVDADGRQRCGAYGSATADGLRALLACGLATAHPRVVAAREWLERNFRTDANPGDFAPARAAERHAVHYYWLWSAAHAFAGLERRGVRVEVAWAERIAAELIETQLPDGSWRNAYRLVKEDDPLVATPLAAGALGVSLSALQSRGAPACPAGLRTRASFTHSVPPWDARLDSLEP